MEELINSREKINPETEVKRKLKIEDIFFFDKPNKNIKDKNNIKIQINSIKKIIDQIKNSNINKNKKIEILNRLRKTIEELKKI